MDKPSSKTRSTQAQKSKSPSKPLSNSSEKSRDSSSTIKKPKSSSKPEKTASDAVRLHITPLTAESAKAIVPAKHLTDASFHSIDTFPERSYGFVTLPRSEADQLRKKFNGTVFRGVKMSIEEARPAKKVIAGRTPEKEAKPKKKSSKTKPSEREDGVLSGFELPEGRQVKRGWTKDTQKAVKSKGKLAATQTECLFKTVLPANIASEFKEVADDESKKKDKTRTIKNQIIVKEFKNATKFPDFLKMNALPTDSSGRSAEFVEGVGWVNAEGTVLDGVPPKRRRMSIDDTKTKEGSDDKEASSENRQDDANLSNDPTKEDAVESAEGFSGSLESSSEKSESDDGDEDSSDVSMSDDQDSPISSSGVDAVGGEGSDFSSSTSQSSDPDSTSSVESESEDEEGDQDEPIVPSASDEKKAKQPSSNFANLTSIFKPKLSVDTASTGQFKFFGGDLDEGSDKGDNQGDDDDAKEDSYYDMPFTPVTPRTEHRYRSGAPTPDTAAAPRFRDLIPFARETSIEREYFPTLTARVSKSENIEKQLDTSRLLFPHTYNKKLHSISIWSSVPLPKILSTGEFTDTRQIAQKSEDGTDNREEEVPEVVLKKTPVREAPKAKSIPTIVPALAESRQPKTGMGSLLVGWAGKKMTFNDEHDIDLPDAPAAAPAKALTGIGSGVTGWSGKKMTFDEDEDDHNVQDKQDKSYSADTSSLKAKTGAGSGVSNWAGTKKTFDDDDDDDIVVDAEEDLPHAPPKSKATGLAHMEVDESAGNGTLSISQAWDKVFYENRGDWNRQWKRKKREAAKAKRKKERVKRGWLPA